MDNKRITDLEQFTVDFGKILLRHQREAAEVLASPEESDQNAQDFARYLRAARANAELTPTELASRADIAEATLYALERALIYSKTIEIAHLQRLAEALDEDVETFGLILERNIPTSSLAAVPVKMQDGWEAMTAYLGSGLRICLLLGLMLMTLLTLSLIGNGSDNEPLASWIGSEISGGTATVESLTTQAPISVQEIVPMAHQKDRRALHHYYSPPAVVNGLTKPIDYQLFNNKRSSFVPSPTDEAVSARSVEQYRVNPLPLVAKQVMVITMIVALLVLLFWLAVKNGDLPLKQAVMTLKWQKGLVYATPLLLICMLGAVLPIITTSNYTLYYTSAMVTETGLPVTVITPGVQELVVSSDKPLLLFNLDISLEWDARNDDTFLSQLEEDIQHTSQFLYDWTNGQAALGKVRVYHAKENRLDSHVLIYASNSLRPNADLGGIVSSLISDTLSNTQVITDAYLPEKVRMTSIWNRFGHLDDELGLDWSRTLADELAHYFFYLPDNYLGLSEDEMLTQVDCQGSAMTDPYGEDYSEFLTSSEWTGECSNTLAEHTTGRADWESITTFYEMFNGSYSKRNQRPSTSPLAVAQVTFVELNTPTNTLVDPFFHVTDEEGIQLALRIGQAQGYLFKTLGPEEITDDAVIAIEPSMVLPPSATFGDFFDSPYLVGVNQVNVTAGTWLGAVSQRNPSPPLVFDSDIFTSLIHKYFKYNYTTATNTYKPQWVAQSEKAKDCMGFFSNYKLPIRKEFSGIEYFYSGTEHITITTSTLSETRFKVTGDEFVMAILQLRNYGITSGIGDYGINIFTPNQAVARAQAALILHKQNKRDNNNLYKRLLNSVPINDDPLTNRLFLTPEAILIVPLFLVIISVVTRRGQIILSLTGQKRAPSVQRCKKPP